MRVAARAFCTANVALCKRMSLFCALTRTSVAAFCCSLSLLTACGSPDEEKEPEPVLDDKGEEVSCEKDSDCRDDDACNGKESCEKGICVTEDVVDCDDKIACTKDSCNSDDGSCHHDPPDLDGDGHGDTQCKDADGQSLGDDCDDEDNNRYPGNTEVCSIQYVGDSNVGKGDGVDEDCDPKTFGERDNDGDGFTDSLCFNEDSKGKIYQGKDCNDFVASVNPAASEVCDYFDNNCDDLIDENLRLERFEDPDGDGFAGSMDPDMPGQVTLVKASVCAGAVNVSDKKVDCGPDDPFISPGRIELCDGVDNNCNGEIDEAVAPAVWYRDFDGDGFGDPAGGTISTCQRIENEGWSLSLGDCDDSNPLINPQQEELCDGLDNDCNPETTFLIAPGNGEDDDNDGAADPFCGTLRPDCADNDKTVYPGAPEICDGLDNDCNGIVENANQTVEVKWYVDLDLDGFGDDKVPFVKSCVPVKGRITRGGDCADDNPKRHPQSPDNCAGVHGVDDDCDGMVDEAEAETAYFRDLDGDGYGSGDPVYSCAAPANHVSQGGDCNEADKLIHPAAAEICAPSDGVDQDCDGKVDCIDNQCVSDVACQAIYGLNLVSVPTTALVSDTFEVTVALTNDEAAPVSNAVVTVLGEPGAYVPSEEITTDASGEATFTVGVGLAEGIYRFTVAAGETLPLTFDVEAEYPGKGVVWSVAGRAGENSAKAVDTSFGPTAETRWPTDIDVLSDGTALVSLYYGQVIRIDGLGQVTVVAGTGSTSTNGDGGPALSAAIGIPTAIRFDEERKRLYIGSGAILRVVSYNTSPPENLSCSRRWDWSHSRSR